MTRYIEANSTIPSSQCVLRKGHVLADDTGSGPLIKVIDCKQVGIFIMLCFSNSFDTICQFIMFKAKVI